MSKNDALKVPYQAKDKRDDVINQRNYNSVNFNTENIDALKTLRIKRRRP